jgi:predicted ATP-binding protein involved in virulence
MRIKQISVTDLFGVFEYVIPLNMEEHITIIHGKNGVGKTTLLKLINGFFQLRYSELRNIPFSHLKIDFDNEDYIKVKKANKETPKKGKSESNERNRLTFYFENESNNDTKEFLPDFKENRRALNAVRFIEDTIPGLERIGGSRWFYLPTSEELSLTEVLDRFGEGIPGAGETFITPTEDWLKELTNSINVRFIEYQRLLNSAYNKRSQLFDRPLMLPSVASYAKELAENIQAKLTEYGTLSQSLDRTFPARVVQQKKLPELTDENLRHKLNELEEKRSKLIEAGLLNRDEDPNFQIQGDIDESTKKILSVYIEDVDKKLSVFNDIAKKTDLIKRIINDKFSYKQINISKDKGFTFTTDDGKSLSPTNLSSGEQHELVLLYELLFKVKPNSLILIDEPELSLHVEWQVQFLKDLHEITKLSNIDVLIATHSPDIIHDRWDLTVELKGPAE